MSRLARVDVTSTLGAILFLLAACSPSDSGPGNVPDAGTADTVQPVDVVDTRPCPAPPFANVRSFSKTMAPPGDKTDVYYPEADASARPPRGFPVALFLQGGNVDKIHYASFARGIAANGFVVVIPNHTREVFNTPGLYAEQNQLYDAIKFAKSEHEDAGSPLAQQLDLQRFVVMGHSFGGAATLGIVASTCSQPFCAGPSWTRPPEVLAAALFGTNLKSPFGDPIPPVDNATIPVLFVQGASDGRSKPVDAKETYDRIRNPPKAYVSIDGMNHYGITDANNPEGALADPNAQTLPQADTIASTVRWMAAFLRAQVLGDEIAAARLRTGNMGCSTLGTLTFEP